MKRLLLAIATAVLLVNTLVSPTAVRADGGASGTGCGAGGGLCKPQK